jgi:hypothetical protein
LSHRATKATSPQLRALGPEIRVLAVFLDAIAAYGGYCAEVQGRVDTAVLCESDDHEGWHLNAAERSMAQWGAKDQYGVYQAAGLTKAEAEVCFLHYDRCLDNVEIGRLLGRNALTVGVQLHKARERLKRLAA